MSPAQLVAIGDSLTQGFQSGSIFQPHLSYPAMIAQCLGDESQFTHPDFSGAGGLPINLEHVFRTLAKYYDEKIHLHEYLPALITIYNILDEIEDYWERGPGNGLSATGPIHRNLAVWGFAVDDADMLTEYVCRQVIEPARDHRGLNPIRQIPEFAMYRTARRTLNPSFAMRYADMSQVDLAAHIAEESGIENLIFWLGANNCLSTVLRLKKDPYENIVWSEEGDLRRFAHQRHCNLWRPEHFQKVLNRVAAKIVAIDARNVFVGTIPHVTIAPICRGVTPYAPVEEQQDAQGYYKYYTYVWVWDNDFAKAPYNYPYLTRDQARLIDTTIDQYNVAIRDVACRYGWHVVDICAALDSLAYRRQKRHPTYQFPLELVRALKRHPGTYERCSHFQDNGYTTDGYPILDTRYLRIKPDDPEPRNRCQGGIVGLDGVHPTTIGYGLIAHEFLNVMQHAGVSVQAPLNWDAIVSADTLVTDLPGNLEHLHDTFGRLHGLFAQLTDVLGGNTFRRNNGDDRQAA